MMRAGLFDVDGMDVVDNGDEKKVRLFFLPIARRLAILSPSGPSKRFFHYVACEYFA